MRLPATDLFFVLLIFQLLFISIFLFTYNRGRKISLRLLALFFLSFGLNLLDSFLLLQRVYFDAPLFALWGGGLPLVYGPLLWLYTQSVLQPQFRLASKKLLHFLPFVLLTVFSIARYQLLSATEKQNLLTAVVERRLPLFVHVWAALLYLHFFAYAVMALLLVYRQQHNALQHYSDTRRTNLHWLRSTILFFMGLMLLAAISNFVPLTPWAGSYFLLLTIVVALFFLFLNQVLLKALRNPQLFSVDERSLDEARVPDVVPPTEPHKYAGSALPEGEKQRIQAELLRYMQAQKPYLQPELSLEQLADALSVKPRVLSQVLNEKLGQNFFDFINTYRIEEAKNLLAHPKDPKLTVLEVLYEVGFNSKSSFNTLFKKQTGLTPTEFKKQHTKGV